MDQIGIADWAQAAGMYTPFCNIVLQWLKQSPKINNNWLWWLAPIVGLTIAFTVLIVNNDITIVSGVLSIDLPNTISTTIKAIFGSMLSLTTYDIQKQLPIQILAPGPNNYGNGNVNKGENNVQSNS